MKLRILLSLPVLLTSTLIFAQVYTPGGTIQMITNGSTNLGVGTSDPAEKVEVKGNVRISGTSGSLHSELIFHRGDGAKFASFGQGNLGIANSTFDIQHFNGNDIRFLNSGIEQFRIVAANGNVGIGTSTPDSKLSLVTANPGSLITMSAAGANAYLKVGLSTDYSWIQSYGSKPLRINNDGNDVLLNVMYGNVGIGTSVTDSKLTVKGTIHAEEVRVDLNVPGPGYVFQPDYELPSLEEVQAYINQNKHLPEVPSAKEMEQNGINLSEMNMILLKKVEELTLYLIEANEKIESLSEEVKDLKKTGNNKVLKIF